MACKPLRAAWAVGLPNQRTAYPIQSPMPYATGPVPGALVSRWPESVLFCRTCLLISAFGSWHFSHLRGVGILSFETLADEVAIRGFPHLQVVCHTKITDGMPNRLIQGRQSRHTNSWPFWVILCPNSKPVIASFVTGQGRSCITALAIVLVLQLDVSGPGWCW